MGVVRINAIGPGAVEYLLHGCDPAIERGEGIELEQGQEPGGRDRELGLDNGVGYFLDADGEPAGRWLGTGMAGLELSYRAGEVAREDDLRAIFGELRFPASERAGSTSETPVYLGRAPRKYRTLAERVEAAFKAEPDATLERQREIEIEVSHNSKSNTAYYDVTFSPVKSASVYYAALLAAGDVATAQAVREAHDRAVQIAIESAETDVAWAKTGRHGRASKSGRTTGKWEKATGLSAVLFAHHTNRDGEPQLHAHVAVLNRVGIGDGRVFALDGQAFRPVKDAMATAYDRAFEAILSDLTGVVFETRLDRKGREIAGIDPALMEEASTRSREHVEPRIEELMASYEARHGYEPGPKARRAIVDQAVKQTRQPKTGPGGPAAVADWINKVDGRRERLEATLDAVDDAVAMAAAEGRPEPLATGHDEVAIDGAELATGHAASPAMASGTQRVARHEQAVADGLTQGPVADAAREEMGNRAIIAGLEDVQARYPNWRIGGLVAAIDMHLGADVSAVGLGIAERRAWVRGLAERALDPRSGFGVVQVSMGDPVPVPDELRRAEDGRSTLRAHIDERYATAEHLGMERRVVAMAQAGGAPRLQTDVVARVAAGAERRGLSSDQVAALTQILASDRRVEVLVGPAGAGKSHTLGTLARCWNEEHGGRVIGTATAEIATRNLAELGMDAINTRGLLTALTPDENGRVRLSLTEHDLLVVDEAGMATTADLDAVLQHAAAAGAKVVWSGDHYQLAAVEAGGMFAHLAERPGAIELEQVHRFSNQWERDASLRVRTGDATVAGVYADEGRLRTGTVEQMEYLAGRDYLADRIEGASSLLIVGSNAQADQLSRDIQAQLVELGMVGTDQLARLKNGTTLRAGDLIQARVNDRSLRVDGGVDEQGRPREALPVTNRELYTVIGYDLQDRELLVRDERGAVAHLPEDYVRDSVSLAYAVTNHAAQGVTVDRGRPLADRSWTRESLYPAATRGRHVNVVYIVTEVSPDAHDPQRVRDTAEARMVQILERTDESKDAALTVLDEAQLEARSMLTLGEHYDHHAAERGHVRHAALVAQYLGAGADEYEAYGALLGQLRAIELAGHDVGRVLEAAVDRGTFRGSRDLSKVLHRRVEQEVKDRVPEFDRVEVAEGRRSMRPAWEQLAAQHRDRAAATGNARETYLALAAEAAQARTDELGVETAAAAPEWALAWLGPVPDRDVAPSEYQEWLRHAGEVASYREFRGVPDEQISIGAAPPPSQQLAHELWTRAAAAGTGDPRVVEWREASDADLRDAVARWEREQAWAPLQVAAERGEALALAHDARNDAILGRAQLATMDLDTPGRSRLEARVHADEVMAEQAEQFARSLDAGYTARAEWWDRTAPEREAAAGAQIEMARRGLRPDAEQLEPIAPDVNEHPTPEAPVAEVAEAAELQPGTTTSGGEGPQRQQRTREPDLDDLRVAPRQQGTKQAAELELASQTAPDGQTAKQPEATEDGRRQRFQEALIAEHERALAEVDSELRLGAAERDAAVRAHNFETFVAELRSQHGLRLDPEGTASDLELAHRRAAEIAGNDPATPALAREFDAGPTTPSSATAAPEASTQPVAAERRAEAGTRERSDEQDRALDRGERPRTSRRTEDPSADLAAAARASRLSRVAREARNEDRGPANESGAETSATRTPADEIDRELAEQEQLEFGRIRTPAEQALERQQQQELERTRDEGLERD